MIYVYAILIIIGMVVFCTVGGLLLAKYVLAPMNEALLKTTFDPLVRRAENIKQGRDPNYQVPMEDKDIEAVKEYRNRTKVD